MTTETLFNLADTTVMDRASLNPRSQSARRVRSIFASDLHLGCPFARAPAFLDFIQKHHPQNLYLVGDIIDGWSLKRKWRWNEVYSGIVHRLLDLAEDGCRIRYAPGNHDEFLRGFFGQFGFIDVADEFIHVSPRSERYLVLHGDQFDKINLCAPWLSALGSVGYDVLLWGDRMLNATRRCVGLRQRRYSAAVKNYVKRAMRYVSDWEEVIANHARQNDCSGVICGHIHAPKIIELDDVVYCNSGDWIENCSALLEYEDGSLEIVHHPRWEGEEVPVARATQWRRDGDSTPSDRLIPAGVNC